MTFLKCLTWSTHVTNYKSGTSTPRREQKMDLKLDIKTLITLLTIAATLGGFYYTTQSRVDSLEEDVMTLSKQVKRINKQIRELK